MIVSTLLLALLSASSAPATADPAATRVVPLVALRRVEPHSPVEAAASGVAPNVTVRVRVDVRGKPSSVEILSIRPSTPFDDLFRKETLGALAQWRFSPALEDGRPVETTLEWTIQYSSPEKVPAPNESTMGRERRLTLQDEDRAELMRWSHFLATADRPHRLELLEETRATAEKHLYGEHRTQVITDRFVVVADGIPETIARTVASNLEACYGTVYRLLSPTIQPQPAASKVLVYVYSSADSFRRFVGSQNGLDGVAGLYNPLGIITLHRGLESDEDLLHTLLHEGVHAFVLQHVARPGVLLPVWFSEGFAEYVGNSQIKDGKIVPGSHRQNRVYHAAGEILGILKSRQALGVDEVKVAILAGTAIPVGELVALDRSEFYGKRARYFYTQSWMLVHFLRHGRPTWSEKEFPTFFLYLAEGYAPDEAFRMSYGSLPAALETEFREYVKKF